MRLVITILLAMTFAGAAKSQTRARTGEDLVQTEFVPSVPSISPGETVALGIRFRIEPGWHIYWKNPGDSGQAPEVKWTAPRGFEFSALEFPVPKKFEQGGGILAYGYQDEVVLLVRVTAPADAKPGESVRICGDLFWLVCEDVCLPGRRTVTLDLPVSSTPAKRADTSLDKWLARLPEPTDEAAAVQAASRPELNLAESSATQRFVVTWHRAPDSVEWFPPASDQFSISDIRVETHGLVSTVMFSATPFAKTRITPATLDSVLAYTLGGQRKGLSVPVRVLGVQETPPDNRNPTR